MIPTPKAESGRGGGQRDRIGPNEYLRLIGGAEGLLLAERVTLYAMLRWADASGRLWPSVESIASAAGLSRRGTQQALRSLERRGILATEAHARGGRHRTPVRRIDADALRAMNPAPEERAHAVRCSDPTKGAPRDHEGRTAAPERAHAATPNSAPGAPEPSIQPPENNQENHHEAEPPSGKAWAARGRRHELERAGVCGPNLERLAAAESLTAEAIRREAESIRADPTVRDLPAVLVARLANRAGIPLRNGQRQTGERPDWARQIDAMSKRRKQSE